METDFSLHITGLKFRAGGLHHFCQLSYNWLVAHGKATSLPAPTLGCSSYTLDDFKTALEDLVAGEHSSLIALHTNGSLDSIGVSGGCTDVDELVALLLKAADGLGAGVQIEIQTYGEGLDAKWHLIETYVYKIAHTFVGGDGTVEKEFYTKGFY